MDYFTLIPDKTCPFVRICNHTDPKILQAVMRGEAHQVPDGMVFRLKEVPDSGMPDIIFQPVFWCPNYSISASRSTTHIPQLRRSVWLASGTVLSIIFQNFHLRMRRNPFLYMSSTSIKQQTAEWKRWKSAWICPKACCGEARGDLA